MFVLVTLDILGVTLYYKTSRVLKAGTKVLVDYRGNLTVGTVYENRGDCNIKRIKDVLYIIKGRKHLKLEKV